MDEISYSGSFEDIIRLEEASRSLSGGAKLTIVMPKRSAETKFPDIEENAFQSFKFAVDLLLAESDLTGRLSIEIKYV